MSWTDPVASTSTTWSRSRRPGTRGRNWARTRRGRANDLGDEARSLVGVTDSVNQSVKGGLGRHPLRARVGRGEAPLAAVREPGRAQRAGLVRVGLREPHDHGDAGPLRATSRPQASRPARSSPRVSRREVVSGRAPSVRHTTGPRRCADLGRPHAPSPRPARRAGRARRPRRWRWTRPGPRTPAPTPGRRDDRRRARGSRHRIRDRALRREGGSPADAVEGRGRVREYAARRASALPDRAAGLVPQGSAGETGSTTHTRSADGVPIVAGSRPCSPDRSTACGAWGVPRSGPALRASVQGVADRAGARAAPAAWLIAADLFGHDTPFFAPIAAVVSLGTSYGPQRRVIEVTLGWPSGCSSAT